MNLHQGRVGGTVRIRTWGLEFVRRVRGEVRSGQKGGEGCTGFPSRGSAVSDVCLASGVGVWGAKHQQEGRAPPPRVRLVKGRSARPRPSRVLRSSRGRSPARKPNVWWRRNPGSPALKFPAAPRGSQTELLRRRVHTVSASDGLARLPVRGSRHTSLRRTC
ncbi:hypothetical protein NDU88_002829 [Pleurodeles waltl]|uniref:Uncharacterized protein n=1 Tax=Pleurodeles waltl TaxID=8319 RepID=A0AAV7MTX3_PLEWA|nr:hypothetical protein NDU88_002829 [Pleurodeles waltl]